MKHYIITEKDIEVLKSMFASSSVLGWDSKKIDDWVEYLKIQNNK